MDHANRSSRTWWMLAGFLAVAGFFLLAASWNVLCRAQQSGRLATEGPYARVRHPQYVAFVTIMLGFLLQWPTVLTLATFPVLVVMYARLARREEADMRAAFGEDWERYAARTPRFIPQLGRTAAETPSSHAPTTA